MDNFKLGRLIIKNFKSYAEEFSCDFTKQDLVVLDGPNGFGKTTIFDAIELALTGTIDRFKNSKIIDTKQKNKNMLISTNGKEGEPAFIILELIDDNESCIIGTYIEAKKGQNKEWTNHIYRGILKCWPNNLINTITEIKEKNADVTEELQATLSYRELNKMFTVFNYIQQEETLHFLKLDEKSRFKRVDHLFGIEDERGSLDRLESLKDSVNDKLGILNKEREDKNIQLEELKTAQGETGVYVLSGKTIQEANVEVTTDKLDNYKASLEECKKILSDGGADNWALIKKRYKVKELLSDKNKIAIKNLLHFSKTPDFTIIESLSKHVLWASKVIEKCKDYSELKTLDTAVKIDITDELVNKIEKRFSSLYEKNKLTFQNYKELLTAQSTTEKLLSEISNTRQTLIKKFRVYCSEQEEHDHADAVDCPLCGQPYDDLVELNAEYEKHKADFETLHSTTSKQVNISYDNLVKELIIPAIDRSKVRFDKYGHYNAEFKTTLIERQISKDRFNQVLEIKKWFEDNLPKYSDYVCPSLFVTNYVVEDNFIEIKTLLEKLDQSLSLKVDNDFDEVQNKLSLIGVDANTDISDWTFTLADVDSDIQYIVSQAKLLNDNRYKELVTEIEGVDANISNYQSVLNALDEGHKIYKTNIACYEKEIAKKIQIPFYNISSKILQTRLESGIPASGVILEAPDKANNKGYYRFCSSAGAQHDAWSTMSSGQLAGVIIAFMLAMNKVFPTGLKTLLIDDPIQSMDDINMASFIQLLREEFTDYQIIMSTHESRVANYVMYKYKVSALQPMAINLKNEKRNRALAD